MTEQDNPSTDLLEAVASDNELTLYRRYSEAETAQVLRVSLPTIRRMRSRGEIAFLRVSERQIQYFGFQIAEYLIERIENKLCQDTQKENSSSENTISENKPDPRLGADATMTRKLVGLSDEAS